MPVERVSFPDEWRRQDRTRDEKVSTKAGGGQGIRERNDGYQGGGGTPSNKGPPAPGNNGYGGGQQASNDYSPRRGGQVRDWKAGWVDTRNHKIKSLMDPYLEQFNGRIHLNKVLDTAGKCQTDLPTLSCFCYSNGRPFLCWNSTLGRCMYHDCRYLQEGGHPGHNDIPDEFAKKVCTVIGPGIQTRMQAGTEGSPGKKIKGEPATKA